MAISTKMLLQCDGCSPSAGLLEGPQCACLLGAAMRLGARSSAWYALPVDGPVPAYELDAVEEAICAVSIPIDDLAFDVHRVGRAFQIVDGHTTRGTQVPAIPGERIHNESRIVVRAP